MIPSEHNSPLPEGVWRAALAVARDRAGGDRQALQETLHSFGILLRNARWEQQLSLEEVAHLLGIAPQTLGYWEIGWITSDEFLRRSDKWMTLLHQDDLTYLVTEVQRYFSDRA